MNCKESALYRQPSRGTEIARRYSGQLRAALAALLLAASALAGALLPAPGRGGSSALRRFRNAARPSRLALSALLVLAASMAPPVVPKAVAQTVQTLVSNNNATGALRINPPLDTYNSGDGTAVGDVLHATRGTMHDPDGMPGGELRRGPFEVRWYRVDGATETPVWERYKKYTIQEGDVGKHLKLKVSFTDNVGVRETLESALWPITGNLAVRPPGPPIRIGSAGRDQSMRIWWDAPTSHGGRAVAKYQYRLTAKRSVGDGANNDSSSFCRWTGTQTWSPNWTDVADSVDPGTSLGDERTVAAMGLTNGTYYCFQLRAVSSAGNGTEFRWQGRAGAPEGGGRPSRTTRASPCAKATATRSPSPTSGTKRPTSPRCTS